jgi:4-hydroxybenzoate polyprenyltransferase
VFALQASPLLGGYLGGFSFGDSDVLKMGLLFLCSLALTAHVFVFNDWAGQDADLLDPQRANRVFVRQGIGRDQVARVAIGLLILSNVFSAFLGAKTVLIAAMIALLSLLYSSSSWFGRSTPVVATLNHLIGGSLHFLLGYTLFHDLDTRGLLLSLFFGLVFAAGHLNQEVRDHDGDLLSGTRTSAVVFGSRRAFIASLWLFTMAYGVLLALAVFGFLPGLLLGGAVAMALHLAWSLQALKRGMRFETALWMQRRYRLLFGAIGLGMLVRW